MKSLSIISLFILFTTTSFCQSPDLSDMDVIIFELYDVISGEKSEARDWDHFRNLFKPDARLIPTRDMKGAISINYLSPEDYITNAGPYLETNGFFEKEIYRVTERFGNIAHVFSTYETYSTASDTKPFARGINSIQLLFDNNRWWIVNIYWQAESDTLKLPAEYLPN